MKSEDFVERLESREAKVGVIGLGYVGLPLAMAAAHAKFDVIGFEIDMEKAKRLNGGESYIDAVRSEELAGYVDVERFRATADFELLSQCDVIVICVPTPLSKHRVPDLSFVVETTQTIRNNLREGQLIVLESTTYPGTTVEVVKPILEETGLSSGNDFWIGFSPEREDPGNKDFHTASIPKIVSGDGADAGRLVELFYGAVVERVVAVSSPSTAEAVKITENVFRSVNIALVNELKVIFAEMDIDIWEVIDAAATKPFGFMPFYPGPGLGGHCIPIDPYYLAWKSREYGLTTRFIELAGEINIAMPRYVIANLEQALDQRLAKSLGSARVLLIGLAYKKNVSDIRESPTFALMDILRQRGAAFDYHDPHVPQIPMTREYGQFAGLNSVDLDARAVSSYDAVLIATDHDVVDFRLITDNARLVIDTRNALERRGIFSDTFVKS